MWGRDIDGPQVAHAVAVNCNLRVVFCNTLGGLPFSLAEKTGKFMLAETAKTHDFVAADRFKIRRVTRVWRVQRISRKNRKLS
jgi:hypothetical protein